MPTSFLSSPLWAVTSYFNPAGFESRLKNYELFRRYLPVPLLTLTHDPDGRLELRDGDADILVRVSDGDVMWQKERLFNLALRHLPDSCVKIAWLDCDIVFVENDWAARLEAALDVLAVVQPYRVARHILPEDTRAAWLSGDFPTIAKDAPTEISVVDLWQRGVPVAPSRHLVPRPLGPQPICGLGWATRRDIAERLPFFDAFVIGSGDAAFFSGISGDRSIYTRPWGPPSLLRAFEEWAGSAWEVVGGRIASLDATVCSLWHGSLTDRNYVGRWSILTEHAFDPVHDLVLSPGGAWSWNSDKPDMHAAVKAYFGTRAEDH